MTSIDGSRWQDVLAEIRKTLRKQQYDTWFKRVQFTSSAGEEIQLVVPNRFFADWLESNYRSTVEQAIRTVFGVEPRVHFEVDASTHDSDAQAAPGEEVASSPHSPNLNKAYQLDTFVVGNCNRLAQAAARSVAESPGAVYNPLFVHSRVGMGKTHLLQAVCHRFLDLHPGGAAAYVGASAFVAELVRAKEEDRFDAFRARYRALSLLAFDDVQLLAGKEASQEEFFHIFNDLHSQKQQVVVSADRVPQDIQGLSDRLVSRLAWGLIVNLERPDHEMKLSVLAAKAAARRMVVPADVLEFVASSVEGSIRELEGALVRLAAFASLSHKPVSVAVAREALATQDSKRPRVVSVPQIQDAVARHFGLKIEELLSKKRSRSVAFHRQVGMFLARRLTNLSFEEIGSLFGGRDHTTILYACEKIEKQSATDKILASKIEEITQVLHKELEAETWSPPRRVKDVSSLSATGAVTDAH
jgi:chromosomal replication initiator protein